MSGDPGERERHHNDGQEDRASGKDYNPPNDFLGGVFNSDAGKEMRDSYIDGWENAKSQEDD